MVSFERRMEDRFFPFLPRYVRGNGWLMATRGALPLSRWGIYFGQRFAESLKSQFEHPSPLLVVLKKTASSGGGRPFEVKLG